MRHHHQQPRQKRVQQISDTSETDTDLDIPMTEEQSERSKQWKIGTVKQTTAKPKTSKGGSSEATKRIVVGIMIFSWYTVPIVTHPLVSPLFLAPIIYILHDEAHHIKMKTFEEGSLFYGYRQLLYVVLNFAFLPYLSCFQRDILERSGVRAEEYPLLFAVLFEKHKLICLVLSIFMGLFLVFMWRKRNLRYQLYKSIGLLFWLLYITALTQGMSFVLVKGGRWWNTFSVYTVAANDSSAYFAGKMFGKHHLIGLSPNKTIEGFVGGFVINVVLTYILASLCLKSNFWTCAPEHLNYGLFEDWQCETLLPIYMEQEYALPVTFMGYSSINMAPAVLYTVVFALYSSLVAPFVGFFASGFKRTVGIKDFATTLPGHGGVIDRMDCISNMCIFTFILFNQAIWRDQADAMDAYSKARELDDPSKLLIVNTIAERLGLPTL